MAAVALTLCTTTHTQVQGGTINQQQQQQLMSWWQMLLSGQITRGKHWRRKRIRPHSCAAGSTTEKLLSFFSYPWEERTFVKKNLSKTVLHYNVNNRLLYFDFDFLFSVCQSEVEAPGSGMTPKTQREKERIVREKGRENDNIWKETKETKENEVVQRPQRQHFDERSV